MANEELEFTFPVDLSKGTEVDVTMQDPPEGVWEVQINELKKVTAEKTTLRFIVTVVDEAASGCSAMVVCGTDFSKNFNVNHLVNLCSGLHTPEGKYLPDPKSVREIKPAVFVGKRAYIVVKPPKEELTATGAVARADKNFISRAQYERAKKAGVVARPASAPQATAPAANGSAAPEAPPAPAQAAADLDKMFA